MGEIERSGKYSKYFCANRLQARVRHVGISVISCCYTQCPLWLTVKDHFPFYLHPFTAYFYMQRSDSKDHYMQLKLGDVLRIEIKNHDVLLPKTLGDSFMVTHYNWLFTLWWTKVPKEIFFEEMFL